MSEFTRQRQRQNVQKSFLHVGHTMMRFEVTLFDKYRKHNTYIGCLRTLLFSINLRTKHDSN